MNQSPILEPYATRVQFQIISALPPVKWQKLITEWMTNITLRCGQYPGSMIGHVKGFADGKSKGFLKVSLVSLDHPAEIDGELTGEISELSLDLNIHVYGVKYDDIHRIVGQAAALGLRNDEFKGLIIKRLNTERPRGDAHPRHH